MGVLDTRLRDVPNVIATGARNVANRVGDATVGDVATGVANVAGAVTGLGPMGSIIQRGLNARKARLPVLPNIPAQPSERAASPLLPSHTEDGVAIAKAKDAEIMSRNFNPMGSGYNPRIR